MNYNRYIIYFLTFGSKRHTSVQLIICEKVKFVLILYKSKLCFFQGCTLHSTYLYSLVIITIFVKQNFFFSNKKTFYSFVLTLCMIGSQHFVTETYVVIMKFQTSLENGYLKCLQEKKNPKILTNVDVAHRTLHAQRWHRKMMGFVYKPVIIPPCSNCRIYSHGVLQCTGRQTI